MQGFAHRIGVARLDFFVALSAGVIAVGLMLPAIQAARDDATKQQCTNNLRKLGQGFAEYEKVRGGLPPRRTGFNNGAPYGGWGSSILPHVGEEATSRKFNPKFDFFDPANKEAVETQVSVYRCPASPERVVAIQSQASTKSANPDKDTVYTVRSGPTDFISSNGLLFPAGGYNLRAVVTDGMIGNQRQSMSDNDDTPYTKITDGLSCTLLLIEQAGRPNNWRNGKKTDRDGQFGMANNARGPWAGWGSIAFGPASRETGENPGKGDSTDCTVNCNNTFGIYGFHEAGANVLLCDGSVRFVGKSLNPLTLAYLTLRDDGHVIGSDDY